MTPQPAKIAFIGAGRMASAMVGGILRSKIAQPENIACISAADGTAERLSEKTGIRICNSYEELLEDADIVVLAIKPQQLDQLPGSVGQDAANVLVLSILAGTNLQRLSQVFSGARNVVRAMPNTPGQIGAGITCYASTTPLTEHDTQAVQGILKSLGEVVSVDEDQLDAVTAVSGSGPAYFFEMIAALSEGGVAAGLPKELSAKLALHTALGSARLVAESGEDPEALRDAVSSPGGTTLAGLSVMQERQFRDTIRDTVIAARKRSIELSQ